MPPPEVGCRPSPLVGEGRRHPDVDERHIGFVVLHGGHQLGCVPGCRGDVDARCREQTCGDRRAAGPSRPRSRRARDHRRDGGSRTRRGAHREAPARRLDPVAHAPQAGTVGVRPATPVVVDGQLQARRRTSLTSTSTAVARACFCALTTASASTSHAVNSTAPSSRGTSATTRRGTEECRDRSSRAAGIPPSVSAAGWSPFARSRSWRRAARAATAPSARTGLASGRDPPTGARSGGPARGRAGTAGRRRAGHARCAGAPCAAPTRGGDGRRSPRRAGDRARPGGGRCPAPRQPTPRHRGPTRHPRGRGRTPPGPPAGRAGSRAPRHRSHVDAGRRR